MINHKRGLTYEISSNVTQKSLQSVSNIETRQYFLSGLTATQTVAAELEM